MRMTANNVIADSDIAKIGPSQPHWLELALPELSTTVTLLQVYTMIYLRDLTWGLWG